MDLQKHFGDSYDVVKKALLSWLSVLGPWRAHPMFTHDVDQEEGDQFSRLLGVPLLSRERLRVNSDRLAYLAVCDQAEHVFLDPTTGLKLGHGRAPQYLFGDELVRLADARPRLLTLVFDQSFSRAAVAEHQVRSKLEHFFARGLSGFAYVSHAAFIAVGKDPVLVRRAHDMVLENSGLPASRLVVATPSNQSSGARVNVLDFRGGSAWEEIQRAIWECTRCKGHPRVVLNIRQQTALIAPPTKLLVISLAPPFARGVTARIKARSVTNSPEDPLRRFLQEALGLSWQELAGRGLRILHAVKCAILPDEDGFQNPPRDVVDTCVPEHLAREFREARPAVVVTLGQVAYRGLIRALLANRAQQPPPDLKLTEPPSDARTEAKGYTVRMDDHHLVLFASEFPRAGGRGPAGEVLRRAARRAGIIDSP